MSRVNLGEKNYLMIDRFFKWIDKKNNESFTEMIHK